MGVSINGNKYVVKDMLEELNNDECVQARVAEGAKTPEELLELVLPYFGVVHDGYFFTVYNEYYDDYNPGYEFTALVAGYYGLMDKWGDLEWSPDYEPFAYGANAYDVAETLGLELDDDGDDDV